MTASTPPDAFREAEDSERDSERPDFSHKDRGVPDFVRRLLEAGLDKLGERPDQLRQRLAELKLPKEAWLAMLSQLDDSKSGLYRIVAREVKDFLENTNFADDLVRALTKLSFEIKTEVRFIPNDAGLAKPNVRSRVQVKNADDTAASAKESHE